MVGWNRSTGSFDCPPFVDPESGATLVNPEDKRDLLVHTLLQQAACRDDIPMQLEAQWQPRLPFPQVTSHEIYNSLLRIKSTTPGVDGVPVQALKQAWPFIWEAVHTLYSWCLEISWHPLPF